MTPTSKSESKSPDPGVVGSAAERAAYTEVKESQASSRKIGYNSNGEPEMYPSDIAAYQTQYGLTAPEAEQLWQRSVVGSEDADSVANSLITGRVVYRVSYEQVLNPPDNALTAVQVAAARQEKERRDLEAATKSATANITTPTADRTQPEAGPYGPHAEYEKVVVPVEEVAHNTNLTPEQVKEAGLTRTNTGAAK